MVAPTRPTIKDIDKKINFITTNLTFSSKGAAKQSFLSCMLSSDGNIC
jgi:hypothetical protein